MRRGRGPWRAQLAALIGLVVIWLALWGSVSVVLVLAGIALSAVVLVAFPLPPIDVRFRLHPWRALLLLVRFLVDVVVASVDVALLAVRRRPVAGAVLTVRLTTDSDVIQTLTGLAVSLVPGSLIVDADPAARTLTIHVLDAQSEPAEIFRAKVLAQEARIAAAFGEPTAAGRPARPVPEEET